MKLNPCPSCGKIEEHICEKGRPMSEPVKCKLCGRDAEIVGHKIMCNGLDFAGGCVHPFVAVDERIWNALMSDTAAREEGARLMQERAAAIMEDEAKRHDIMQQLHNTNGATELASSRRLAVADALLLAKQFRSISIPDLLNEVR